MKLEFENTAPVSSPTAEDISNGIESLDGKRNSFAILSSDDLTYLQIAGDCASGFTMEYQNGSTEEHYNTSDTVSAETVIATFQAFARGETDWFDHFTWEKTDLNQGSGCLPVLMLGTLAMTSVGLAALIKA